MEDDEREGVEGGSSRDLVGVEGGAIVTRKRLNERKERGESAKEEQFSCRAGEPLKQPGGVYCLIGGRHAGGALQKLLSSRRFD